MKLSKCLVRALSLCLAAPAAAFQPGANGLYASSQLTTSMGFIEAQMATYGAYQMPSGTFSLFGIELEQTLGWSHWISLDIFGGYGVSLGGTTTGAFVAPAKAQTYDLGSALYTSVPCSKNRRLFLEPMVGFFAFKMNTTDSLDRLGAAGEKWVDQRFWGPMAGLFFRMMPTERLIVRVGGAYLVPSLWERVYPSVAGAPISDLELKGARSGALASLSLAYEATAAFSLYMKFEYQAYGVTGSPLQGYAFTPNMMRTRFAWGSRFSY